MAYLQSLWSKKTTERKLPRWESKRVGETAHFFEATFVYFDD